LDTGRARRTLWAIRLILYPALAIGAVLLLVGRSSGDEPARRWLDGTTSAGGQIQVEMAGDRPVRLGVDVTMRCPRGLWTIGWWPRSLRVRDGSITATENVSHHYRYRNQAGARTITLGARIVDGRLEGRLSATEHFDDPAYGAYACESGAVTFSARPQR